jgi:hypothetical protein
MISDYVVNFLNKNSVQVCTIVDKDGEVDTQKTNRINEILTHQINIFQYIQEHISESPEINITYFVADSRKRGGRYVTETTTVKVINDLDRLLYLDNGVQIKYDNIYEINIS